MAQGDFFEFSVAYPLKNHKFRLPTQYSTTLSSAAAAAATTIEVPTSSGDFFGQVIQPGDRLEIGPNSSGVSENAVVKSFAVAATVTVTLKSALTNTFQSGNTVLFKGTRLGGGWTVFGSGMENQEIAPLTTRPFDREEREPYGQVAQEGSAQTAANQSGLNQDIDSDLLQEYAWHRFGCEYRADIDDFSGNNPRLNFTLTDFEGSRTTQTLTNSDQFDWTRFASSSFFVKSSTGTTSPLVRFLWVADTNDQIRAWLRGVFLEHAKGTGKSAARIKNAFQFGGTWTINIYDVGGTANFDVSVGDKIGVSSGSDSAVLNVTSAPGSSSQSVIATLVSGSTSAIVQNAEIQVDNSGRYQVPDHPQRGSVRIDRVTNQRTSMLADNSGKLFDPMSDGDRSFRWRLGFRYVAADQDIWDSFMTLLHWQELGNMISCHPFIDSLPHAMVGRLGISGHEKTTHFSLARHDFDGQFEELSV